jgi:hypothetical protein
MNPFGKMDGGEHSIQWLDREHNVDRLSLAGMLLGDRTSEVEKKKSRNKAVRNKSLNRLSPEVEKGCPVRRATTARCGLSIDPVRSAAREGVQAGSTR